MDENNTRPLISVVIPVKNEAKFLEKCLKSHFSQTLSNKAEIIVIDSGSTDGSLDIAKKYPVRLYQIKPEEFSFSGTRNLGAELARGEFVLMTSGDAWTDDKKLYEKMISYFADKEVVAVKGMQVVYPSEENNPFEYYFFSDKTSVIYKQFSPGVFETFPAKRQYEESLVIDNVITMFRKEALIEQPFEGEFGEDIIWAKKALTKGWKIVVDFNIRVFHYHHYSFKRFCKRYRGAIFVYRYFNYFPRYSLLKNIARTFYFLFLKPIVKKKKFYWLIYNLKIAVCKKFCLSFGKMKFFSKICDY